MSSLRRRKHHLEQSFAVQLGEEIENVLIAARAIDRIFGDDRVADPEDGCRRLNELPNAACNTVQTVVMRPFQSEDDGFSSDAGGELLFRGDDDRFQMDFHRAPRSHGRHGRVKAGSGVCRNCDVTEIKTLTRLFEGAIITRPIHGTKTTTSKFREISCDHDS